MQVKENIDIWSFVEPVDMQSRPGRWSRVTSFSSFVAMLERTRHFQFIFSFALRAAGSYHSIDAKNMLNFCESTVHRLALNLQNSTFDENSWNELKGPPTRPRVKPVMINNKSA